MAGLSTIKISQLPVAPALLATDIGPFDHSGTTSAVTCAQVYAANRRDGIQNGVAADGSASATITFATAFPTSLIKIDAPAFTGYSGTDAPVNLVYMITGITTSGFTILVAGGQPGSTVSVNYGATGN